MKKYDRYVDILPATETLSASGRFDSATSMGFRYQICGGEGMAEIEILTGRYLSKTYRKLKKFVVDLEFPEISKRDLKQLGDYTPLNVDENELFPSMVERVRFLNRLELNDMDYMFRPGAVTMRFHSPSKLTTGKGSKGIKKSLDCHCGMDKCYVYSNPLLGRKLFNNYLEMALASKRPVKKHVDLIWASLAAMYETVVGECLNDS